MVRTPFFRFLARSAALCWGQVLSQPHVALAVPLSPLPDLQLITSLSMAAYTGTSSTNRATLHERRPFPITGARRHHYASCGDFLHLVKLVAGSRRSLDVEVSGHRTYHVYKFNPGNVEGLTMLSCINTVTDIEKPWPTTKFPFHF